MNTDNIVLTEEERQHIIARRQRNEQRHGFQLGIHKVRNDLANIVEIVTGQRQPWPGEITPDQKAHVFDKFIVALADAEYPIHLRNEQFPEKVK